MLRISNEIYCECEYKHIWQLQNQMVHKNVVYISQAFLHLEFLISQENHSFIKMARVFLLTTLKSTPQCLNQK